MSSVVKVSIHASQFPEAVRRDLRESLHLRQVNHKFHYDSVKQTQKWLALHEAYSPARTDAGCAVTYERAFAVVSELLQSQQVNVVGLGCGGGQKDTQLLDLLRRTGKEVYYSPVDVGTAMVLVAREAALKVVPAANCFPLVCDLSTALDLAEVLAGLSAPGVGRLVTFFGMIPNFEPDTILPRLASVVQPGGHLLFSANLAPGTDYAAGVRQILPLYDNALTRDWLTTFLFDLGVEPGDGEIRFSIDEKAGAPAIKRVVAYFHFLRPRRIRVGEDLFEFPAGETIRLFFSYRHTPAIINKLLSRHGLRVRDQWITDSQEEGVFLCQKASA